jgi:hypothetical protein
MSNKQIIIEWLNKGDGGSWYEPYVTNKDLVLISFVTILSCAIIILGCILISNI